MCYSLSQEQIKIVLEIVQTLAIIAASWVAIRGVNAWEKEFQGKRKIELAEEALYLFYRAEWAVEAIRFPVYDLAQGQTRQPESDETPEQRQARDRAYVTFKKIMEQGQIFDELHKLRFRFMVRFGKENEKLFDDLKRIVDEIKVSARELAELWTENTNVEEIKHHKSIIWSGRADDAIKGRLEKIISDIEEICKPIILGKK